MLKENYEDGLAQDEEQDECGLLDQINAYDRRQQAYIRELRLENAQLRKDVARWMTMALRYQDERSTMMLKAALAGAFEPQKERA